MKLKGKVAIITGGARDIGSAVSLKLAKEGAKIAINYHGSEHGAKKTMDSIKNLGGEAIIVQGDMTKKEDIEKLVSRTTEAFGNSVDILVNVAGGLFARKT